MKYVVLVFVSAFGGFVAAWLLFRVATSPDVDISPARPPVHAGQPAALPPAAPPAPAASRRLTFSDIQHAATVFDQLYVAWQLAARSDVPALQKLIGRCLDEDDPLYTENVVAIFLERYTAIDPAGAMDFVTHEYRLDQATFQGDVLTSWVRYDPQAAIDYFKQITNQEVKMKVGVRLLADPTLAQAGLVDQVKAVLGPYSDRIVQQLRLRQMDPVDLFRQSLTLTGSDRRSQMINAVSRWAARDPAAALGRIANLSDPGERQTMLQIAIRQYAQQDAKAALNWLQANHPGDTNLQRQVLNSLAAQNVDEALPLVEDFVRRTGQTSALDGIIDVWARRDPQKAIDYVESLDDQDKSRLYRTLAFGYMRNHPVEGLNWVASLGADYSNIKNMVLQQINGENETAAEQVLRNATDTSTRTALIQGIARYKARSDPRGALDWLEDYSGDQAYLTAYGHVLTTYSFKHPQDASRLLDTSLSGSPIRAAASSIVSTLYKQDPQAAADWATSLPPSDARIGAMSRLVMDVATKDPDRAFSLSQSLPANVRRNLATSIGYSWVSRHPEQVEEIISKLNPSPQVASQLRQLASNRR